MALSFKVLWDTLWSPDYNMKCEIVRNNNMKVFWGDTYDPTFNYYNESFRWMKEIVYGLCKS